MKQSPKYPYPKNYDEHMTWRARWYFIIVITIIYGLFFLTGLIGCAISKDLHYLFFLSPTVLMPFIYYLVPMDYKSYELKKLKIQAKIELKAQGQGKKKQKVP